MNSMHRKGTAIALAAALALGLSACGGGGGGNLSNEIRDLKADLAAANAAKDAAEARAAAAEAAKAAADAAQATAEAARAAAEAAQMTAESERDASNAAAAAAAQAQADAEAAQAAAEAAQAAAESAQATAEMQRDAANAAAMAAEAARTAAEAAQAAAEADRDAANAAQMAAEAERDAANTARMAAEAAQAAAVAAQAQAEADRAAAVAARDAAVEAQRIAQQAATDATSAQHAAELARDAAIAERDAANSAKDAADAAKTAAEASLATAQADLTTARGEVTRLTNLLGDDATPDSVQGMLAAAKARVMELETMIGSADDAADAAGSLYAQLNQAKDDAAMYKKMLDDAAQKLVDQEMLDRGKAVAAAISMNRVSTDPNTNAARETPNSTGGFDALDSQLPFAGATGVSAKRGHDGMVTVDVTLTDTEATKFAGDAASAGTTWTGAMLTRNLGEGTTASEETLMVYTDIGRPTAWPLATEFEANESHVLIDNANELGRVMVDSAPAVGDDRTFNYAENAEFTGSYRDVPGTFTCGSGGCTVSTAENGTVTVTGTMNFEPTDPAATYPRQDASYVYFGWWLNKPASATATHMVEAFAGTNGGTPAAISAAMEGKATYSGPAIGKYVVQTSTAGVVTASEAGHFTALATLNADFLSDANLGTISGKVDGFDTSGEADGSGWRVNLKEYTLTTDANVNARTSVSFGGLTADNAGAWRGTFYDAGTGDAAPGTIIGTFDAHDAGGSANISGAFGAKKQ